jgi:hypothetical protein
MREDQRPYADASPQSSDESFAKKICIFSQDFLKCNLYIASTGGAEAHFTQKF